MTKYILLKTDATIVPNFNGEGLKKKQKAVGGLIQPVHLETGLTAYINEEGLLLNLPVNHLGCVTFKNYGVFNKYLFENCEVQGDILFECMTDAQHDMLKLSLEFGQRVIKLERDIADSKS